MSLFVWNEVAMKYINQFYTKYEEEMTGTQQWQETLAHLWQIK